MIDERAASLAGVRRLDHVAVAVYDLAPALRLYVDRLGARFVLGADNDETGMRIIHLQLGGFKLELMQPLSEDTLLARHLAKRGEGFHHLTFVVEDMATAIDALAEHGITTIGTDLDNPAWAETFVRPADAGGVPVQLVTTDRDWSQPVDGIELDDVLAGRAVFEEAWPCRRADVRPRLRS